MLILIKIVVAVYFLSANFYGFFLIKYHKKLDNKSQKEDVCEKLTDGKLFLTGSLGGALGIFLSMIIFRYRLGNFFLMVALPVLTVINFYLLFFGFSNNFWIISV